MLKTDSQLDIADLHSTYSITQQLNMPCCARQGPPSSAFFTKTYGH